MRTRLRTWLSAGAPAALVLAPIIVSVAVPVPAYAQSSPIFRCEGESGTPTYQNTPGGKNCKQLNLQPLTTVPGPAPRAGGKQANSAIAGTGFSKVDSATQRDRDSDRRRILEDELRKEQSRLSDLRKDFNDGEPERRGDERNYQKYLDRVAQMKEDIARSESNVASIKRELSSLPE